VATTSPPRRPPEAPPDAPEHSEQPPSGRYSTFSSLRFRNYRLLWLGQASHAGALWMEQIARPWLVLELTDNSAAHVGGVVALRTVPMLLFGVWAGVIADRFDRKRVLQTTKTGVLILNIIFATLLVSGRIELWHVYAFSFARGTFMAFDQPARQSLVAAAVPRQLVTNAVALMSATQNTMRIVGAASAGFIVDAVGIEATFVLITIIYSGSVIATSLLTIATPPRADGERAFRAMASSLLEGMRYAAGQPAIRGVLLLSLVYFAFGMSWMQVFAPLFARTVLDTGGTGFGLLLSFSGMGALLMTLGIATVMPRRTGLVLPAVTMGMGVVLVLFSLSTYLPHPAGLLLPFVFVMGAGAMQTSYMSLSNSTLLTAAPEEMRGRVVSLMSLDRAMVVGGAAAGGLLAEWQGVQMAQIMYGVVCFVAALALFFFARGFRDYRTP
jgi:MFS family permease